MTEIYDFLRLFGVMPNRAGSFYTSYAIYLAMEQPERLERPHKFLYPAVAEHYHKEPQEIEQEIRKVLQKIWARSPDRLREIAGTSVPAHPNAVWFFATASDCLRTKQRRKHRYKS